MKTLRGSRTNYLWLDSGPFFQDTLRFFQDVLNKNASGLGPAIISGPIRGRFFRLRDVFSGYGRPLTCFHVTREPRGLAGSASGSPAGIISGPIRERCFSGYGSVFSRLT